LNINQTTMRLDSDLFSSTITRSGPISIYPGM
jgi:hypothetical protein